MPGETAAGFGCGAGGSVYDFMLGFGLSSPFLVFFSRWTHLWRWSFVTPLFFLVCFPVFPFYPLHLHISYPPFFSLLDVHIIVFIALIDFFYAQNSHTLLFVFRLSFREKVRYQGSGFRGAPSRVPAMLGDRRSSS